MATKKEKEELNRHLESTSMMLCEVIYGIFEDRRKEEEIKIDVVINNSRYTKITASIDKYGVSLCVDEEYTTEADGTIIHYCNDLDALGVSALIEIYREVEHLGEPQE